MKPGKHPRRSSPEKRVPKATTLKMPADLVAHPRYGSGPLYTRLDSLGDDPHFEASGQSDGSMIIRGTAILARPMFMGPTMYFDVLKTCVDCGRHFIFHAAEQQYWYEELGFSSGADCIRCVECRKQRQAKERSHSEYQRLIGESRKSLDDHADLVVAALDLYEQGKLKSFDKVRALLNEALGTHPDRGSQSRIENLREQIKAAEQAGASNGDKPSI